MKQGLVHLYCGDGKGKTTAAIGLCVRAAGRGLRVLLVQFLKGNPTGELAILDKLEQVTVLRQTEQLGFTFRMNEQQKQHAAQIQQQLFEQARRQMQQYDLLILDDLGSEFNSSFLISTLYSLLNNRLGAKLPTIVTTNITDGALLEKLYTEKISSRLSSFVPFFFMGDDIRAQKAEEA